MTASMMAPVTMMLRMLPVTTPLLMMSAFKVAGTGCRRLAGTTATRSRSMPGRRAAGTGGAVESRVQPVMRKANPSESPVTFRHIPCNSSFMKYLTKFQWLTLAMAALYIVSPVDMIPEILTGPFRSG